MGSTAPSTRRAHLIAWTCKCGQRAESSGGLVGEVVVAVKQGGGGRLEERQATIPIFGEDQTEGCAVVRGCRPVIEGDS